MMHEAGECWDEVVKPEEIPLMVDTFVEKVVVSPRSTRFYTISIHWLDPEWGIDQALCFRSGNPSLHWSKLENKLLVQHYPHATREELMKAIPTRSFHAMRHRASILGLPRLVYEGSSIPHSISWQDFQLMQEQGLTTEQMQSRKGEKIERLRWTEKEDRLLIQYYQKAPREELLQAIPTRSYKNMVYRAGVLGITRQFYEQETVPANASWQDWQIMQEYGLTEDQLWGEQGGKLIAWNLKSRPSV